MTELEIMIVAAIASFLFFLIGPAAIWRITKTVAEFLLVILVFIWAL